jgi:hypothetical protein
VLPSTAKLRASVRVSTCACTYMHAHTQKGCTSRVIKLEYLSFTPEFWELFDTTIYMQNICRAASSKSSLLFCFLLFIFLFRKLFIFTKYKICTCCRSTSVIVHHHRHHVQEGLGLIPVPCILKMKLVPLSLPQSSCVSSSFWFIL